jgi:uncharacterized coiled-coil protein SlyX
MTDDEFRAIIEYTVELTVERCKAKMRETFDRLQATMDAAADERRRERDPPEPDHIV